MSFSLQTARTSSDDDLAAVDIARLNLACAAGLPGSEELDIDKCLKTLDDWAEAVRFETKRHMYRLAADPKEFDNSFGKFCMLTLVTVLQKDCGVKYNPDRIFKPDFRDSRDLFIHGIIDGKGGTCCSMPVLYVAVARRLGWPLFTVPAKAHLFARWDDPAGRVGNIPERFNIEATGPGAHFPDDEHYMSWPMPINEREIRRGMYLRSMTPRQDVAEFLASRGHCLRDHGRIAEASDSYDAACELDPDQPDYHSFYSVAQIKLDRIRNPQRYAAADRELARRLRPKLPPPQSTHRPSPGSPGYDWELHHPPPGIDPAEWARHAPGTRQALRHMSEVAYANWINGSGPRPHWVPDPGPHGKPQRSR